MSGKTLCKSVEKDIIRDMQFSPQLVKRVRDYFKKEYGKDMNPEEAQLFLRSLATVYDSLTKQGSLSPSA